MNVAAATRAAEAYRIARKLLGRIAAREVACAGAGLKPVRLMAESSVAESLGEGLSAAGLACIRGSGTCWLAADAGKGGWSSAGAPAGHGIPYEKFYVAATAAEAVALRRAEERESDEEFGRLLLVPACCRAMFLAHAAEAGQRQNDFFRFSFPDANTRVPWQLNLGGQYFDASLISHYPCNAACADSLLMASISWRIIASVAPEDAQEILRILKMPCLYTESNGVHLLGQPAGDGWYKVADAVQSTADGPLAGLLRTSHCVRCDDGRSIQVRTEDGVVRFATECARLLAPEQLPGKLRN